MPGEEGGAPTPEGAVTIFFAGDVMTARGVDQILEHPSAPELRESYVRDARRYVELAERVHGPVPAPVDGHYVWGDGPEARARAGAALSIVNLETSVTTSGAFWPGKAVHYRMHPDNVGCLSAAGLDACTLANNHVLDFGFAGLLETVEVLRDAGIRTAGAGRTIEEAAQPARLPMAGGGECVVFSFGSESSGIPPDWAAGPFRPGVALIDERSLDAADAIAAHVRSLRGDRDIAVASIHWGSNWGWEIPPAQVAFAHRLIDRGVDVVHGHSSHHARSIELYRGKLVLYGCGDLVTDYEGIGGHREWRGEVGAMYFATLARRDASVARLHLVPTRMQRLRLTRAAPSDDSWLAETLTRIGAPFGTRFELRDDGVRLSDELDAPKRRIPSGT